jgi:hypothetical protein
LALAKGFLILVDISALTPDKPGIRKLGEYGARQELPEQPELLILDDLR